MPVAEVTWPMMVPSPSPLCLQVEPFKGVKQAETAAWFYLDKDGQQAGPMDLRRLAELFDEGEVDGLTLVWHAGLAEWKPVAEVRRIRTT